MGLPLAKDGLCLSSQSLKEKGDITFIVFSWNGGSLKTSSVHATIIVTAGQHLMGFFFRTGKKHFSKFVNNSLGSGFPDLHCFDAMNLQVISQPTQPNVLKQISWFKLKPHVEVVICLTLWLSAPVGFLDSRSRTISRTEGQWSCPRSTWQKQQKCGFWFEPLKNVLPLHLTLNSVVFLGRNGNRKPL